MYNERATSGRPYAEIVNVGANSVRPMYTNAYI